MSPAALLLQACHFGVARDYAEARFMTHVEQFKEVEKAWFEFRQNGALSDETESTLKAIEVRDSIFAEIDPSLWIKGSQYERA